MNIRGLPTQSTTTSGHEFKLETVVTTIMCAFTQQAATANAQAMPRYVDLCVFCVRVKPRLRFEWVCLCEYKHGWYVRCLYTPVCVYVCVCARARILTERRWFLDVHLEVDDGVGVGGVGDPAEQRVHGGGVVGRQDGKVVAGRIRQLRHPRRQHPHQDCLAAVRRNRRQERS